MMRYLSMYCRAGVLAAAFSAVMAVENVTTTRTTTTTLTTRMTTQTVTVTTTTTFRNMTNVVHIVTGRLTVTVSDPSAILNYADAKRAFESAMASQLATAAGNGIAATNVNVTVSAASSSRRLQSGGLSVSYEIKVPPTVSSSSQVVSAISGKSNSDLKTLVTSAVATAAQTVSSLSSLTVSAVTQTVPTVEESTMTPPSPTPSPTPTPSPSPSSSAQMDGVKRSAMMHAMSFACAALGMFLTMMH
eukprot:TRINITY_DN752_c0_g2_i1.p1 TRINITY_DN752_c0_g2~~TRINITY_DN752_c0_g2_i1.p1  ORF type:complete len:246 (-),score=32.22 TRINITY_DN752_c0_g2_i1:240-977(-)